MEGIFLSTDSEMIASGIRLFVAFITGFGVYYFCKKRYLKKSSINPSTS